MRRADRLFQLVQLIRGRRLTTAEWLAARLPAAPDVHHRQAKALVACVRLAQPRLDPVLARDADDALTKILAVLPPAARAAAESLAVYAPAMVSDNTTRERLRRLREACESRRFVQLEYESLQGALSQRRVRPLGVFYWDAVWTVASWCEMRQDFRNFRVDRMRSLQTLDESFRDEAGKTLADLLRLVRS